MDNTFGILGYNFVNIKKDGEVWSLKLEGERLLGKTTHSSWMQLGNNYSGSFAFLIDGQEMHVVFLNARQEISYCRWVENTWETRAFKLVNAGEKISCLKLLLDSEKRLNIFVLSENYGEKTWKIFFFHRDRTQWSTPEIIDEGFGFSQGQFSIGTFQDLVYIVYQVYKNNSYQLVYRMRKDNKWFEKQHIFSSQSINLNPSLEIDSEGNYHAVWVNAAELKFSICYCKRSRVQGFWQKMGWSKKQLITTSDDVCLSPLLILNGIEGEIFWQQKEEIYCYALTSGEKSLIKEKKESSKLTINLDKKPDINFSCVESQSTALALLMENPPISTTHAPKSEEVNLNRRLKNINGNFRKMVFETDSFDLLESLRIKIQEHEETIINLNSRLCVKEAHLAKLQEKEAHLNLINSELKESLLKKEEEQALRKDRPIIKNADSQQEINRVKKSLEAVEKINHHLRIKLAEKEREINSLLKTQSELEEQLTKHPTAPFPFLRKK